MQTQLKKFYILSNWYKNTLNRLYPNIEKENGWPVNSATLKHLKIILNDYKDLKFHDDYFNLKKLEQSIGLKINPITIVLRKVE